MFISWLLMTRKVLLALYSHKKFYVNKFHSVVLLTCVIITVLLCFITSPGNICLYNSHDAVSRADLMAEKLVYLL